MVHQRSSKSTVKHSLRTPTTPSQYFPPSYFAAAAGVPYPPNLSRDEATFEQHDQFYKETDTLSSNMSHLVPEYSPHTGNLNRTRRKSQLCDLESQLLPTLSDTVERMTRPPAQLVTASPSHPDPTSSSSPGVTRTPSMSSQRSFTHSLKSEACSSGSVAAQMPTIQFTPGKQPASRSPSIVPSEPPPSLRSSSRSPNPKSILKSHTTSDRHLQVQQAPSEDTRIPIDHARKADRSPVPIPPEPLSETRIESTRQTPACPRPKIDGSYRTGRARSRTDPGTPPKGLPSSQGRNTQQPNPQSSSIPRRVGIVPGPVMPRTPNPSQVPIVGSAAGSVNLTRLEKRHLFVTNAEMSSSSSEGLTRYVKPKTPSRTDSQSSTEYQLRPPRFGLGLGLSGVNESKNSAKRSPGPTWTSKIPGEELYLRYTNSPGNKKHQHDSASKRRDRLPSKIVRVDGVDGQRRQRELLSLMHGDLNDSSGCDSRPTSSEGPADRSLLSDSSGDSLRLAFEDSGSEYSPVEEDDHARRRNSTRWEKVDQTGLNVTTRPGRADLAGPEELPARVDEQHTPRASSYARQHQGQIPGSSAARDEGFLEAELAAVSDEESGSLNETPTRAIPQRYSSELSRLMAMSMAAAARQREAFGISSSSHLEGHEANASQLPHADSVMSLIGGDRWQECELLATGSLLQQLDQTGGSEDDDGDDGEYDDQRSSAGELSLSSAHTRSSASQDSMYSLSNTLTRGSSKCIVVPESPPAMLTAHDQQWQTLEKYLLDTYGEVEIRRQRFVWELIESEDSFVTELQNMIQLFILPLRIKDTRIWVSGIPSDVAKLFDWLEDIVRVHAQLSSALTSRQIVDHPRLQMISEIFRGFVPRLETYQPYLVKLEFAASVIDGLLHEGKNDFGDFIKLQEASDRCQGWSLEKYLVEPVNQLAQYPDVFMRLLQLTPKSHPDYMSTLSLLHATKLTIRVLSEVKDREDAYELAKMACSGIKGLPSVCLVHRDRRLFIRGPLTCVQVSNDEPTPTSELPADAQTAPREAPVPPPPRQRPRRSDKLTKAVSAWRGRSNSIKSTASTVVSFGTAPSSFDVHVSQNQPALPAPVFRVESAPVDVEVLVFSDLVLLARRIGADEDAGESELEPLEGFGVARIVSVLDEMDRRACITLDLAPLTPHALEEGYASSMGPVVTVSLSLPRNERAGALGDWLAPLRRCCQYTRRALSSLGMTHVLIDRAGASATAAQQPVLSLLAAGLPMPKSPSMQIEDSELGMAGDSEQLEREERGWWSKRFHEVFAELSAQEGLA